jgi:8-oxo-dGTP pyrophosphatase MutT (NUDIX family)
MRDESILILIEEVLKRNWSKVKELVHALGEKLSPDEFEKELSPLSIFIRLYKDVGLSALDIVRDYEEQIWSMKKDSDYVDHGMYSLTRNKMKPFEMEPTKGPYPRALSPVQKSIGDISMFDRISSSFQSVLKSLRKRLVTADKTLFENKWTCIKETDDGYVYYEGIDGVGVLPYKIDEDTNKISYLVRDEHNPLFQNFITVVTGRRAEDEHDDENWMINTAVRELFEEAGIEAEPERFTYVGELANGKGSTPTDKLFIVDVTGLEQTTPETDGSSYEAKSSNFWVDQDEFNQHCANSFCPYLPKFLSKLVQIHNESSKEGCLASVGVADLIKEASESLMLTPKNTDLAPQVDWRYPVRQENPGIGHRPFMRNDLPFTRLKPSEEDSHTFFFGPAFPQNLTKLRKVKKSSYFPRVFLCIPRFKIAQEKQVTPYIGVDLDGTLAHYDKWRGIEHVGKPIMTMINRVKEWLQLGIRVKVFTARASEPAAIPYIAKWLEEQGLGGLEITNIKDHYMIQIWDDRAVAVIPNTGIPVMENPDERVLDETRKELELVEKEYR